MLKRLVFCVKLQVLHKICIRYILLLDFLKPVILLSSFLCHLSFFQSNIVVFYLILLYLIEHYGSLIITSLTTDCV